MLSVSPDLLQLRIIAKVEKGIPDSETILRRKIMFVEIVLAVLALGSTAYITGWHLRFWRWWIGIRMLWLASRIFLQARTPPALCLNETRKSCSITFTHRGQEQIVWLPYQARLLPKMNRYQVLLEKSDGDVIDVTQCPGVPYLVTPAMLGGSRARIHDRDEDTNDRFIGPNDVIQV